MTDPNRDELVKRLKGYACEVQAMAGTLYPNNVDMQIKADDLIAAAEALSTTGGEDYAFEPFIKAAEIIRKRPGNYQGRIATFGGLVDALDLHAEDFLKLADAVRALAPTTGWRDMLMECAGELHAEIEARYSGIKDQPAAKRRYERDMGTVLRAKAMLASPTPSGEGK